MHWVYLITKYNLWRKIWLIKLVWSTTTFFFSFSSILSKGLFDSSLAPLVKMLLCVLALSKKLLLRGWNEIPSSWDEAAILRLTWHSQLGFNMSREFSLICKCINTTMPFQNVFWQQCSLKVHESCFVPPTKLNAFFQRTKRTYFLRRPCFESTCVMILCLIYLYRNALRGWSNPLDDTFLDIFSCLEILNCIFVWRYYCGFGQILFMTSVCRRQHFISVSFNKPTLPPLAWLSQSKYSRQNARSWKFMWSELFCLLPFLTMLEGLHVTPLSHSLDSVSCSLISLLASLFITFNEFCW